MNEKKIKKKIDQIFKLYEEDIDEEAMKQDIFSLVKESFEEGIKEKIEICGVIGCIDWEKLKETMIIGLIQCNDEKTFLKLIEAFLNGIGTPKQLAKKREKLGIHHFNEKELDAIDKFDKKI
jgi:hypothetical protein